jgi:hypothetical protein
MASSLGELVATGVLRADNAALLMTITPNLTLETVLGPQQILQLASTLRMYNKVETESKKTAASAIEKLLLGMAEGSGCAVMVGQPSSNSLKSPEPVPWDALVEPWVCQPAHNDFSDNTFSEGHGGLPVILEDDSGVLSPREEHSQLLGQSKGSGLKPADDSNDSSKDRSRSREKRNQSRRRSTSCEKVDHRERGKLQIEPGYGNGIGTVVTRESRSVGAESRSLNRPLRSRRTAPRDPSITSTKGSLATRESSRGGSSIENRSATSHATVDQSMCTEKAISGSRGQASSRTANQDFTGSVSIIKGDSSREDSGRSRERVKWGSLERNTRKEEPGHLESERKGPGFLRMLGIRGNKNKEDENSVESDSDESDVESDSESSSSEPSEESADDYDGEAGEEIEHALTTEGSADVLERKQTLKSWMESRKKNKQPPLEKRVHHLLAAGREKKKDKKVPDEYDQGGILGAASEDLSSTGSLNTFTSIPSQVHVLGEDAETTAALSTTVTAPSPLPLFDSAGNASGPIDTDSLDQLRRLFHVEGIPELDDCVEVEVEISKLPGIGKRREDLILLEQDPPSEQPTPKKTVDPLQIYEPKHDEKQKEHMEPLKNGGKGSVALKRRDESMNLLMSFSKSGAEMYGSGSNSSGASEESNSTGDDGSLVEAIANELMGKKKMSLRQKMQSTAIIKEGSHENSLARSSSDISRDAALQGCAAGMVCRPSADPYLSPTAEQKSTLFFPLPTHPMPRLEMQHRQWQQQTDKKQQQKHKRQPQKDSQLSASHGIYTVTVATSDSSCSATSADNNSTKKRSKGESATLGFWNWLSSD